MFILLLELEWKLRHAQAYEALKFKGRFVRRQAANTRCS